MVTIMVIFVLCKYTSAFHNFCRTSIAHKTGLTIILHSYKIQLTWNYLMCLFFHNYDKNISVTILWLSEQWISSEILETISVELFLFHPSVLEPNLDLSVCKTEHSGQMKTFLFVYVHIEKEFSFKFSDLVFWIRTSLFSGLCCT